MCSDILQLLFFQIVGAGVRAFEKSGPKKEEQYRITHEGVPLGAPPRGFWCFSPENWHWTY